jgi:hypothetical protein
MRRRMVADFVSLGDGAFQDLGMTHGVFTEHEERLFPTLMIARSPPSNDDQSYKKLFAMLDSIRGRDHRSRWSSFRAAFAAWSI